MDPYGLLEISDKLRSECSWIALSLHYIMFGLDTVIIFTRAHNHQGKVKCNAQGNAQDKTRCTTEGKTQRKARKKAERQGEEEDARQEPKQYARQDRRKTQRKTQGKTQLATEIVIKVSRKSFAMRLQCEYIAYNLQPRSS